MTPQSPQAPAQKMEIGRRGFLATAAGGLSLGFFMPPANRVMQAASPIYEQLNAYVRVGTDGSIALAFGGAEMGQGAMSGLAQILAEELMVDWSQISVQQALVDPVVSYITGGSSAVSNGYAPLRLAGATVRELLIAAAMVLQRDSKRANYSAASAVVTYTNPTTHAIATWTYGSLAVLAASQPVPANIPLTDPSKFRLIGQPVQRVDIPSKTDGSAIYGIDVRIPGMVFASVVHCPTIGGTLASTPVKPPGAIAVVPCTASDSRGVVAAGSVNAVAVVATDTWTARNLAKGLSLKWNLPPSSANIDSAQILALAQQLVTTGTPIVAEPNNPTPPAAVIEAQVASAMAGAKKTVDATYTLPYLAHSTMEVMNCSVNITFTNGTASSCEVWAPSQAAAWVAGTASAITGVKPNLVTVHTTFLGGGLGRKIEQDYISQAVQVAMAVKKPVKLTWFREEDIAHDQYRPFALVHATGGLDASGNIVAWFYRNVSPSILLQRGWINPGDLDSSGPDGAVGLGYALGTHVVEWVPLPAGIPVGFWRSVGNSINAFVVESMIDELALAAGIDPFTFRYNALTDPRARAVLTAADALSSWRHSLPNGHAWGVAISQSFGTWVCEVMDVSQLAKGSLQVNRVACVVDCGMAINPDSVQAQMQGGIAHGLNAALWGQMTFTAGKANQSNFSNYRVMRIGEMPQITVQLVTSSGTPSGIGEPAVPPCAPALANAYAKLTGTRVRSLPFFPGAVMGGL